MPSFESPCWKVCWWWRLCLSNSLEDAKQPLSTWIRLVWSCPGLILNRSQSRCKATQPSVVLDTGLVRKIIWWSRVKVSGRPDVGVPVFTSVSLFFLLKCLQIVFSKDTQCSPLIRLYPLYVFNLCIADWKRSIAYQYRLRTILVSWRWSRSRVCKLALRYYESRRQLQQMGFVSWYIRSREGHMSEPREHTRELHTSMGFRPDRC